MPSTSCAYRNFFALSEAVVGEVCALAEEVVRNDVQKAVLESMTEVKSLLESSRHYSSIYFNPTK